MASRPDTMPINSSSQIPGSNHWLAVTILATLTAALVALDPMMSIVFPRSLWNSLYLDESPYRVSLLIFVALLLLMAIVKGLTKLGNYQAIFLVLIVVSMQLGGINAGPIDILDIMTLLAFMAWLMVILMNPSTEVVFPGLMFFGTALLIMDLPYMATMGIGSFIIGFIKFFKTLLLAFMVVNLVRNEQAIRLVIRAMITIAVISALTGIAQSLLYLLSGISITLMDDLESAYKPTPIGFILRASALCPSPHFLSSFLLIALPMVLWQLFDMNNGKVRKRMLLGFIILFSGIILSWNFGAILAACSMIVLFPVMRWPRYSIHIVLGILLLAVISHYTGLLELGYSYTLGDKGVFKGVDIRLTLMTTGFETLERNSWLGTGMEGFSFFTQLLNGWPVHNAGVQSWVELGLPAFVVFITMNLVILTQLLILGIKGDDHHHIRFRMLALGLVALIQLMFSEPYLNNQIVWFYLAFSQGAILVYSKTKEKASIQSGLRFWQETRRQAP